jgi:hypothetical protein
MLLMTSQPRMSRLWAILLAVPLTSFLPSSCGSVNGPPPGWRFPVDRDYSGDWKSSISSNSEPFHIRGDFNGDAIEDEVWILLSEKGPGWGLFVFLGTKDGHKQMMSLETEPGDPPPQHFEIRVAEPGGYDTACGKGRCVCDMSEPATLRLQHPAIDFVRDADATVFFWWDDHAGRFKRTKM